MAAVKKKPPKKAAPKKSPAKKRVVLHPSIMRWLRVDLYACLGRADRFSGNITPAQAWRRANRNDLVWVLQKFKYKLPPDGPCRGLYEGCGNKKCTIRVPATEKDIRKMYPKPPPRIMRAFEQWAERN